MDLVKCNNVKVVGDGFVIMVYVYGFGCDQSMWCYLVFVFESGC